MDVDRNAAAGVAAIRRAQKPDLAALAALAERTFRDTYAAHNTPQDMELYCRQHLSLRAIESEFADPAKEFILCECGGELIAFAQLVWGAATTHVPAKRPLELRRIYVLAGWLGKGIAQNLLADLKARALRGAADYLWLGVWEQNSRAIAFYQKSGFNVVGRQTFQLGSDLQRDLVVAMPITASA